MRIRYQTTSGGLKPVARVYTREEHRIDIRKIDPDAIKAISRLDSKGFTAYLVGGAVRDLLLGRVPKDFDIATDASPRQVHKMFSNSRIIGKRFKLVHLIFGDKIFEISTFRGEANSDDNTNNVFGTMDTDAKRRDFSINSLYYDPVKQTVIDYNNSIPDFKRRRIRSVLPLADTFVEDPVRMIRAIKYSVTTGFKMDYALKRAIRKNCTNLAGISSSRLTEEVFKILGSGCSSTIIRLLDEYKLLVYIMPCLCVYTKFPELYASLDKLDEKVNISASHGGDEPDVQKWEYFKFLTESFIVNSDEGMSADEHFKDIFRQVKVLISPITPPNYELELACFAYLKEKGFPLPKGSRSKPAAQRMKESKARAAAPRKQRRRMPRKRTASPTDAPMPENLPEALQS